MRLGISEILKKANEIDDSEKRIEFLHQHNNNALQIVLKYCFDEKIKFLLPQGKAPYKPSEFPDSQGMLYQEARKLYMFVENGHPELQKPHNKFKREQLFINLLESLDKDDAELIVSVKDKKLPYRRITKKFVDKVFPGLIDG